MKRKSKIYSPLKLAKEIKELKRRRKRIVFTNGCFDILHIGHVRMLEKARNLGDVLVVALNTDYSIRRIKGGSRPVTPLRERVEVLSALYTVDYVTYFNEETPERILRLLEPDILVKGGDYKVHQVIGGEFIKKRGGRVVIVPLIKGKSSTGVLTKIKNVL